MDIKINKKNFLYQLFNKKNIFIDINFENSKLTQA